MRHRRRTAKLGRTSEHRNLMLSNLVCSLILHRRVQTTLAKARAARSIAEKMVTLGKRGLLADRRLAVARLHQEDAVKILFDEIAPAQKERRGGYTRIVKLNQRQGDAAQLAILEWVDEAVTPAEPAPSKAKPAESPAEGKPQEPAPPQPEAKGEAEASIEEQAETKSESPAEPAPGSEEVQEPKKPDDKS